VGITGTQNTGRIARLVAWLAHISGKHVGLACSEGLYLDGRQVEAKDCAHWDAGQRLLINRSVQAAVFENGSLTILAEGLAYDKCSVGVVTDVGWQESLLPFDILDAEQVFKVARTQVDVVLPTGTAVLNAADPQVVEMAELCDGKVIFYGMDANHRPWQSTASRRKSRVCTRRPDRAGPRRPKSRCCRWPRSNRRKPHSLRW
jgi:cyanophycin synthetase